MRYKPRAWLAVPAAVLVCLMATGGWLWLRSRALKPAALLARLPRHDALIVCIDFDALRRAGILQLLDGAKVPEDPEYRNFVEQTRFDYRRDMDTAVAAFAPNGKYLLLKGRFDWKSLDAYVRGQNGACDGSLCRMTGSAPDRRISFFPLRSNLMALAVSQDDSAALRLGQPAPAGAAEIPAAPLWITVPASTLKSAAALSGGARPFAQAVEQAESATLAFAPDGARIAATLDVRCLKPEDAAAIAAQLTAATALLRDAIARENHQPSPADLSGVLAAGVFHAEGPRVLGRWPIERLFLQTLLGGG